MGSAGNRDAHQDGSPLSGLIQNCVATAFRHIPLPWALPLAGNRWDRL